MYKNLIIAIFLFLVSACASNNISSFEKECEEKGIVTDSKDFENCVSELETENESRYFCQKVMDISPSDDENFNDCIDVLAKAMLEEYNLDYKSCQKRGADLEGCITSKGWNSAFEWFKGQN